MSIAQGQTIVYQDLVNAVLNLITTKCQNIGYGSANSIPYALKKGAKYSVSGGTATVPERGERDPQYINYATNASFTNSNSPLVEVTASTVANEFNSFLITYGVARKANSLMTTKGILHFIACASVFIKTKVVVLTNDYTTDSAVVYVPSNTAFTGVTSESALTEDELTKTNLKEMVYGLTNNLGYFQCYYTLGMSCCSSCSSSCSSSSSSSSSSCTYIAYINLGLWQ